MTERPGTDRSAGQETAVAREVGSVSSVRTFAMFAACGLAVFLPAVPFAQRIPLAASAALRTGLAVLFAALALHCARHSSARGYAQGFQALLAASIALLVSWSLGGRLLRALAVPLDTAWGLALTKLVESLLIVAPLVLLARAARVEWGSIFLRAGNLKLGLAVGLGAFVVGAGVSVLQFHGAGVGPARYLALLPWICVFVISNGFMEELLYRGIFLSPYAHLLGARRANVLTAFVFAAIHVQADYAPHVPVFVAITFALALVWGRLMQKTGSLLGPALFHAGADFVVMAGIFARYGVA